MKTVRLTGGDTMNYWINGARQELAETLKLVDVLLDQRHRGQDAGRRDATCRARRRKCWPWGRRRWSSSTVSTARPSSFAKAHSGSAGIPFARRRLPIEEVKDPTGAGDSFAGGFMGYIASQGELNREVLKRALFYGGVMGSFAVERFGTERLQSLTREEIDARFQIFRELTHLE